MASVTLAVSYSKKKLGAAYYLEETATVRLLEDITETVDFSILKALLKEAGPSHVLVNSSQSTEYITALCKACNYQPPMIVVEQQEPSGSRSHLELSASSVDGEDESSSTFSTSTSTLAPLTKTRNEQKLVEGRKEGATSSNNNSNGARRMSDTNLLSRLIEEMNESQEEGEVTFLLQPPLKKEDEKEEEEEEVEERQIITSPLRRPAQKSEPQPQKPIIMESFPLFRASVTTTTTVEKFRPATSSVISTEQRPQQQPGGDRRSLREGSVSSADTIRSSRGGDSSRSSRLLTEAAPKRANKEHGVSFLTMASRKRASLRSATSSSADVVEIVEVEAELKEEEEEDDDNSDWTPGLSFIPNAAFNFEKAKHRLEEEFDPDEQLDEDVVELVTAFRFNYSSVNMIRALGALLSHLDQQRIGVEFEEHSVRVPVRAFLTAHLSELVEVDAGTRAALEIFYSVYNPQSIRRKFVYGNARKEGMSLCKLCNICRSSVGRTMLNGWFERPTKELALLRARQDAIHHFYQDCNLDRVRELRELLQNMKSIRGVLKRMDYSNPSASDWKNLYLAVGALARLADWLVSAPNMGLGIIADKRHCFSNSYLLQLHNLLFRVIDLQASNEEERLVVKSGVDRKLDELRELDESLPSRMSIVAAQISQEMGRDVGKIGYYPLLGYMLVVPMRNGEINHPDFEYIFSADNDNYYRTPHTQQLEDEIGDIKMKMVDRQTTIMLRLKKIVLEKSALLVKASDAAATLDCIAALAMVAREYKWTRPKLVEEPIFDVVGARHPIVELLHRKDSAHIYVANPVQSGGEHSRVKILTGPNASGKSLYLKMVGVITYLAHVGSFVPAERATIGLCNRILSRIHTIDTVLDGLSSFANDLKQISTAIRKSDAHSLLIIDEFGKGTMTEVGLSLLASTLNYWLERPAERCPNAFVASHYHALPHYLHDPNHLLSYHTMEVLRPDGFNQGSDAELIVYELDFQYRLVEGMIDNSYSTVTALKMGVPRKVVERADEIYDHLRAGHTLEQLKLPQPSSSGKVLFLGVTSEEAKEQERQVASLMEQMLPLKHLFLRDSRALLSYDDASNAQLMELARKHLLLPKKQQPQQPEEATAEAKGEAMKKVGKKEKKVVPTPHEAEEVEVEEDEEEVLLIEEVAMIEEKERPSTPTTIAPLGSMGQLTNQTAKVMSPLMWTSDEDEIWEL